MTAEFFPARQRTSRAVAALDGEGTLHERLELAFHQLALLGRVDVVVPDCIAAEVAAMHEEVEKWILPEKSDALGTAISWMDPVECADWEREIRRWHAEVETAADA